MINNNIRGYWEIHRQFLKCQFCTYCAFVKRGSGLLNLVRAETQVVSWSLARLPSVSQCSGLILEADADICS